MSPVSRGRSGKKKSPRRGNSASGSRRGVEPLHQGSGALSAGGQVRSSAQAFDAFASMVRSLPGVADTMAQTRAWWPQSHVAIFADTSALLACMAPAALEQAVCELLGRHWIRMFDEHETGLAPPEWLQALIETATARASEPAVRYLLHGIAAITTPGLAGHAEHVLGTVLATADEPGWLAGTSHTAALPDIMVLRDGYGLRFGVLVEMTGPDRPPRPYLLDIDLCHGFPVVLTAGYHLDTQTAAHAWRRLAGPSADGTQPVPASSELLAAVLPGGGALDQLLARPLTTEHFSECYRADRIVHAAADALESAGRPINWQHEPAEHTRTRAEHLAREFQSWVETTGASPPPGDLTAWVLEDWLRGLPEECSLSCSPHRIAAFTAYLLEDWLDEPRDAALTLLEPWVRYCVQRTALTDCLAEPALALARRAPQAPHEVGRDLGDLLNRPITETAVEHPILDTGEPGLAQNLIQSM